MLAGHLQEKGGRYYAILNCKHHDGKRFPKWVSTDLPVKKGNKRLAEKKLDELRSIYNVFGELILETEKMDSPSIPEQSSIAVSQTAYMLFADYMLYWLSYKETEVDPVTYAGYCDSVENHVYPYFKELGVTLTELEPKHLRDFYKQERIGDSKHGKDSKKGTTVVRYHSNIHNALEVAMKDGLIGKNAAHKERPKTDKFIGSFYLPEEAMECIRIAEGTRLEIAVLFGLFYGLRRSEIVGLKWQNFDFDRNLFTIAHTVTTYQRKGQKRVCYAKDKTKNKSSMRTLPLIPLFREKLLDLMEQQKEHRRLFGNSYNRKYLGYIYVNEIGELIKPDYLSKAFNKFLERHSLRHIRFHDTRHSCASLLLRNGVSMKEIQAWLGHSDYGTTANLYAHLDMEKSMLVSAERLSNGLFGSLSESTDPDPNEPIQNVNKNSMDEKNKVAKLNLVTVS
jgi:integrase